MLKNCFFKIIKFYQIILSPWFGKNCRFWPSCSEYCYKAVDKYGLVKGLLKSAQRILKCGQWHSGGIDLP